MYTAALTAAWVIGIFYATIPTFWLMVHPLAERWRMRGGAYRTLVPLWALIIGALGALTWPWRTLTFYRTPWAWAPAAALIVTALFIYQRSFTGFSRGQLVGRPELEPHREQQLVTSGIRGRVRHPVYLAGLCVLLGWTLGSGLVVLYALLAHTILSGALMIRQEERELERRFGDAYHAYQQRVPALVPRIRRQAEG